MKNLLVLLLLFTTSMATSAQKTQDSVLVEKRLSESLKGNNEIKIDLFYGLFGIPELTYERIFENNRGAGIAMFLPFNTKFTAFNFGSIPYYRYYFGKRKASGMFLEANTAVLKVAANEKNDPVFSLDGKDHRINNNILFGIGGAIGAKFLTRAGFTGEIFLGVGKTLSDSEFVETYARFGYTLGKRF